MALPVGAKLGPYEIISLVGSGGMGEVYRARDPRLGRDIAIKVLPAAFAADVDRLRRFEREARAAAALNHPNIVTVYSVEKENALLLLTMELVEGRSLALVIPKGGMGLDDLLTIAIPLADAIAAAHAKGITHRDLKPANIMIGAGEHAGRVKVLDFGLAQLDASSLLSKNAATLTIEGGILGTVAYMSPEQAAGTPVDARSDLFSLGVILYEMATGQRPFKGDTNVTVLSSILKDTPPSVTDINRAMPSELSRIIKRSLVKDSARRYQTAADLRNELAELKQDVDAGALASGGMVVPRNARPGSSLRRILQVTAIALGVASAAAAYRWLPWPAADRPPAPDQRAFTQLTTHPGLDEFPSLSPDGKWVAYNGNQVGNADIYLQSVGGHNAINLTRDSPEDDTQPAFSPDGEQIAFRSERAGGGIFVMGRTGESVRRITDSGYNPAWSPDATKIVYATDIANREHVLGRMHVSELWTVLVATGEKRQIFKGDAVQPSWSPHGRRIAFWSAFGTHKGQRDIWTISAEGQGAVPVTSDPPVDWNPVWSPDGRHLYFASDRGGPMNLWRVPIDEQSGKVLGSVEPLTTPSSSAALMSLSADGRLLAYTSFANSEAMQSVAFDPTTATVRGEPVPIVAGSRPFTSPTPSPDGRWLAFFSLAPQLDIFISQADGSGIRQLTNDRAIDKFPSWSPDGQQIAFMSNRDEKVQIWSIRPDGSDLRRLTAAPAGAGFFSDWSRDGSKLIFHGMEAPDDFKMFVFDPRLEWTHQNPRAISTLVEPGLKFAESSWSPDGQQLAGTAHRVGKDNGALEIYSFDTGRFTRLYDSQSVNNVIWLNDGRRLLFDDGSKLRLIDSQTGSIRDLLSIAPDSLWVTGLSRDDRTAYITRRVWQADIWLMTLQ
jgi:Tol biopolymer transport system component/serine/threonine protein kinase